MNTCKRRIESYDWAIIPSDLPRKNLVLATVKTLRPTVHPEDIAYPIRCFKNEEMLQSARSLARRPIGLNHIHSPDDPRVGLINGAMVIDTQWNNLTESIEALLYLPDTYIEKIRRGEISKVSVEYGWRDEERTVDGVYFIGLCFDRVDLLEGRDPGDEDNSIGLHLLESKEKKGILEGSLRLSECKDCKGECDKCKEECDEEPDYDDKYLTESFADYDNFADCVAKNKGKVSNVDAYCGYILHKVVKGRAKKRKKEEGEQVPEKPVNKMASDPTPMQAIYGSKVDPTQHVNVTAVGAVSGGSGPLGVEPQEKKPEVNLGSSEADSLANSTPLTGDIGLKVTDKDKSKQTIGDDRKMESKESEKKVEKVEEKKPEVKVEEKKPEVVAEVPKTDTVVKAAEEAATKVAIEANDKKIKELDESVKKLQENAKLADQKRLEAVKKAKEEGKKEILDKVESVLPPPNTIGNWNHGGRKLTEDLRRVLYENKEKEE